MRDITFANFIAGESYWRINKNLHKKLNATGNLTMFFADLIGKYCDDHDMGNLDDENGFSSTFEDRERDINIPTHTQRKYILQLRNLGLLTTKLKGMPPKMYFYINFDALKQLLEN